MATAQEDLKLYYSGGSQIGELQNSSIFSIGGYRSEVIIPNSRFNNLFDEVGIYEITEEQETTRCIFIKNASNIDSMNNLNLWIEGKQDFEEIEVGVSIPNDDDLVQMLDSQFELPYNVEFEGDLFAAIDKVQLIATLAPTKSIALWIKRKLVKPTTIESKVSELKFNFDWT